MKIVLIIISVILSLTTKGATEEIKVPPDPPLSEYTSAAQNADIIILVDIDLSVDPTKSVAREVLHGEKVYQKHKNAIIKLFPKHKKRADLVIPQMEILFLKLSKSPKPILRSTFTFYALHKSRVEVIDGKRFVFMEHPLQDIKAAVAKGIDKVRHK